MRINVSSIKINLKLQEELMKDKVDVRGCGMHPPALLIRYNINTGQLGHLEDKSHILMFLSASV